MDLTRVVHHSPIKGLTAPQLQWESAVTCRRRLPPKINILNSPCSLQYYLARILMLWKTQCTPKANTYCWCINQKLSIKFDTVSQVLKMKKNKYKIHYSTEYLFYSIFNNMNHSSNALKLQRKKSWKIVQKHSLGTDIWRLRIN